MDYTARSSLMATIVGTAFCSLPAYGQGFQQSAYIELRSAGSPLAEFDFTGDCAVLGADMVIAASLMLAETNPLFMQHDADGDGELTGADTIVLLDAVVRASTYDVDGSGSLDGADVVAVMDAMLDADGLSVDAIAADITLDGSVTADDLLAVVEAPTTTLSVDSLAIAEVLFAHLGYVAGEIDAGRYSFATAQTAQHCGGGFVNDGWPEWHFPATSHDWEVVPNDYVPSDNEGELHYLKHSAAWPANHDVEISREWPDPSDCEDTSFGPVECEYGPDQEERVWPANHTPEVSSSWGPHPEHLSSRWPGNHDSRRSIEWRPADGEPVDHRLSLSKTWPPNHKYVASQQGAPFEEHGHLDDITAQWDEDDLPEDPPHLDAVSAYWKPSHVERISVSWYNHTPQNSTIWPPNHTATTSTSWGNKLVPLHWPANHMYAKSVADDGGTVPPPVGPWEMFPGHNVFSTANDIRQLPDLPLPSWPPLGVD